MPQNIIALYRCALRVVRYPPFPFRFSADEQRPATRRVLIHKFF